MPIINTSLSIKDLQLPPGKTGWPWTEETKPLPNKMPDGREWPRISIVTPSYNQGQFLEETIRSVLLQGYPNLEYIIIDGGSTDNSVEIIKKYASFLTYWVSEKDQGQSDALNKGFYLSTGNICAYLNSDDVFFPAVFEKVALLYSNKESFKWLASSVVCANNLNDKGWLWKAEPSNLARFVVKQTFGQAGVFWDRDVYKRPYFDVFRRFGMDHKFFSEIYLNYGSPKILHKKTALFRLHDNSKSHTIDHISKEETKKLIQEIIGKVDCKTAHKIHLESIRLDFIAVSQKLLSENFHNNSQKWRSFLDACNLLIKVPYPFRDRIFISACIRLFLRLAICS